MQVTLTARPATPEEHRNGGYTVVLETNDIPLRPIYLAHAADVAGFGTSPMGALLSRTTGHTFVTR